MATSIESAQAIIDHVAGPAPERQLRLHVDIDRDGKSYYLTGPGVSHIAHAAGGLYREPRKYLRGVNLSHGRTAWRETIEAVLLENEAAKEVERLTAEHAATGHPGEAVESCPECAARARQEADEQYLQRPEVAQFLAAVEDVRKMLTMAASNIEHALVDYRANPRERAFRLSPAATLVEDVLRALQSHSGRGLPQMTSALARVAKVEATSPLFRREE